jgi:hypothetical protein
MSNPEDFKAHISGVFSRASSAYDRTGPRFFLHFGKKLVDFARIPPGARVLDVACGRGAVFVPASTAVSATGQVIGIDISEIEVVLQEEIFYFNSEDEWWQTAWSNGYRGFLERMEPDVIARYKRQATELIREEKTEQGIPDTWYLLCSKAQKPP